MVAPNGPVNILIMSYALKSYKKAFFLGLGAMGADALYLTLLSFGILKFLNSPTGFKILAVFGAIFLTYMAILILKNSKSNIKMQKTDSFTLLGIFVKGFLINLSNPYVIAFWLSSAAVLSYMGGNFVLTLFGLITGIFLWVSLFPLVIFKARKVIGEKIANLFSYISAFILIFFSIILIFKTFWET